MDLVLILCAAGFSNAGLQGGRVVMDVVMSAEQADRGRAVMGYEGRAKSWPSAVAVAVAADADADVDDAVVAAEEEEEKEALKLNEGSQYANHEQQLLTDRNYWSARLMGTMM